MALLCPGHQPLEGSAMQSAQGSIQPGMCLEFQLRGKNLALHSAGITELSPKWHVGFCLLCTASLLLHTEHVEGNSSLTWSLLGHRQLQIPFQRKREKLLVPSPSSPFDKPSPPCALPTSSSQTRRKMCDRTGSKQSLKFCCWDVYCFCFFSLQNPKCLSNKKSTANWWLGRLIRRGWKKILHGLQNCPLWNFKLLLRTKKEL